MKFKYWKFPLPQRSDFFGTSILRPIVPVEVSVGGRSLRYMALIDSGADFCIFDGDVGDELGISVRTGRREFFGGVQDRENGDRGKMGSATITS